VARGSAEPVASASAEGERGLAKPLVESTREVKFVRLAAAVGDDEDGDELEVALVLLLPPTITTAAVNSGLVDVPVNSSSEASNWRLTTHTPRGRLAVEASR
jgi:hypothetical protein